MQNLHDFIKMAGFKTKAEFFRKYPDNEFGEYAFFKDFPQARSAQMGMDLQQNQSQSAPQPQQQGQHTGVYDYHPVFKDLNMLIDVVSGFATEANNAQIAREERERKMELSEPMQFTSGNQWGNGTSMLSMAGQSGGYMPVGPTQEASRHPNVNLEAGEMYDDGRNINYADPRKGAENHEEGGMDAYAHRVLEATSTKKGRNMLTDKLLQVKPDEVEALTGFKPDKTVSHSTALKLADEYYTKQRNKFDRKTEKILTTANPDKLALASAKFNMTHSAMIPQTEQIFDSLFNHQESVKKYYGIGQEANYAAEGNSAQTGFNFTDPYIQPYTQPVQKPFSTAVAPQPFIPNQFIAPAKGVPVNFNFSPEPRAAKQAQPIVNTAPIHKPTVHRQSVHKQPVRQATNNLQLPVSAPTPMPVTQTQPEFRQVPLPKPRKTISYEKLLDSSGKVVSYSPVFKGEGWSHNDALQAFNALDENINGVPVLKSPELFKEMWQGFAANTNNSQWKSTGDNPQNMYADKSFYQTGGYAQTGIDILTPWKNTPMIVEEPIQQMPENWSGFPYGPNVYNYSNHKNPKPSYVPGDGSAEDTHQLAEQRHRAAFENRKESGSLNGYAWRRNSDEDVEYNIDGTWTKADKVSGEHKAKLMANIGQRTSGAEENLKAMSTVAGTNNFSTPDMAPENRTASVAPAGPQYGKESLKMPYSWQQHVPLFDALTLSKSPITYIQPQYHEVQLQKRSPSTTINRLNAEYRAALNRLPEDGTGKAMSAQLFASHQRAIAEEMDRVAQYNNDIGNQNAANKAQAMSAFEQARGQSLQNFSDRVGQRNAAFSAQKMEFRNKWMDNMQKSWATNYVVNDLLPQMYPHYNPTGTYNGKQWAVTPSSYTGPNTVTAPDGSKYQQTFKPTYKPVNAQSGMDLKFKKKKY